MYEGEAPAREVDLGDVVAGKWSVSVIVVGPRIEGTITFPTKRNQKTYGWNDAPPDGAEVLETSVEWMNKGLQIVKPVAEAGAKAYGVPPGVASGVIEAVKGILAAIPNLVKRGRVKAWTRFRQGKRKGGKALLKQVATWRDGNPMVALKQSHKIRTWHFEGVGGELPTKEKAATTGGKPIPDDPNYQLPSPPRVHFVPLEGPTTNQRVTVSIPATERVTAGVRRVMIIATYVGAA